MSIIIVRNLPDDAWQEYVLGHPQGNIFHTPEMYKVFKNVKGHEPELWAAMRNDQIQALMVPVRINLFSFPLSHWLTSWSIVYGSVLAVDSHDGREALARLLSEYVREARAKSIFTELRNNADLRSLQPTLNERGFISEKHLNYLIDLNLRPEEVFDNIGPRTRKNIKRALNKGLIEIEVVNDKKDINECYTILKQSYGKAHVPLADRSLFEAALDILLPKRMIRISLARINGKPAATSIDLLYKKVIFGWYGGVDRNYRSYLPNEVLTWEVFKWGALNGFRSYDFGGAGRPDQDYGVRNFKAKFGGRIISYGRNVCIHSPFRYRLSLIGYKIVRTMLFGGKHNRRKSFGTY